MKADHPILVCRDITESKRVVFRPILTGRDTIRKEGIGMPRSSDRILWVDGLKGLLAVWIILFHYGIGAALFIMGTAGCKTMQRFLEAKPLQVVGHYSFSAILIHMPVLSAVSCLQYLLMTKAGFSGTATVLAVFLAAIPVQILAAFLFQKLTVPLTNLVVEKVRRIL